MSNVIESSKGKEPGSSRSRSWAPFQGAHSLMCERSRADSRHSLRSYLARESRSAARIATHRSYTHVEGEALNPKADEETQKEPLPHPPPARARPSSPLRKLRGVTGRTARCPPPHPRGARLPFKTRAHQAASEVARGHLTPLRCSPLRQEPTRSCVNARERTPGTPFARASLGRAARPLASLPIEATHTLRVKL